MSKFFLQAQVWWGAPWRRWTRRTRWWSWRRRRRRRGNQKLLSSNSSFVERNGTLGSTRSGQIPPQSVVNRNGTFTWRLRHINVWMVLSLLLGFRWRNKPKQWPPVKLVARAWLAQLGECWTVVSEWVKLNTRQTRKGNNVKGGYAAIWAFVEKVDVLC